MQPSSNTSDESAQGPIPAHPLETRERAFQMYCKRATLPEIGAALGVPAATIAGWSMRGKWKARRALQEAPIIEAGKAPAGDSTETSDIESLSFIDKQVAFRDEAASLALKGIREANQLPPGSLVHNAQKVKQLLEMGQRALDLEKSAPSIVVNVGLLGRPMSDRREPISLADSDSEQPTLEAVTIVENAGFLPAPTLADAGE